MTVTHTERLEAVKIIRKTTAACTRIVLRKDCEMGLPSFFKVDINLNYKGRRCYGGFYGTPARPLISMAVDKYCRPHEVSGGYLFREYASIRHSPTIGELVSEDRWTPLRCVVAHEVAHAVGMTIGRETSLAKRFREKRPSWQAKFDWRSPHGSGWRHVYATLRLELGLTRGLLEKKAA